MVHKCLFIIFIAMGYHPAFSQGWVVGTSPGKHALNIDKASVVTVSLNQQINPASIDSTTLRVRGAHSGLHFGLTSYDSIAGTVMFSPSTPFLDGELVTATLRKTVTNSSGDTIPSSFAWTFTIKAQKASGIFSDHVLLNTGTVTAQAHADMDQDGDIDIVAADGDSLRIWTNQQGLTFVRTTALYLGNVPSAITIGDFDGDGRNDCAVARTNSSNISILRNNGNSTFTETQTIVHYRSQSMVCTDFDGDGALDLAIAQLNGMNIGLWKGEGNCSFTQAGTVASQYTILQLLPGDFNNDGRIDFIATGAGNHVIFRNDSSFSFYPYIGAFFHFAPTETFVADFNNDGKLDLLGYQENSYGLQIEKGEAWGSFTGPYDVPVGRYVKGVAWGDCEGDGKLDLVVAANWNGQDSLITLRNRGQFQFSPWSRQRRVEGARRIVAGEFSGDGRIDLSVITGSPQLRVMTNTPEFPIGVSSPDSLDFGLTLIDSTRVLLAKVRNLGTSPLHISTIQSSNPAFTAQPAQSTIPEGDSTYITVGFAPSGVLRCEDSLIVQWDDPNDPQKKISVFGRGSILRLLSPAANSCNASDSSTLRIVLARALVGTGVPDSQFVVTGSLHGRYSGSVSYDIAQQAITFSPETPFRVGEEIAVLLRGGLRSVQGDSLPPFEWRFTIAPRGGSGVFSLVTPTTVNTIYDVPLVADLDNNGFADLVYTDYYNNSIRVMSNHGNMTFSADTFPGGQQPQQIVGADFDGDGIFELAMRNYQLQTVTILKRQPGGGYGIATVVNGVAAYVIMAGDVDGDGHPDLVAYNYSPRGVAVYRNMGNLVFQLVTQIPASFTPRGGALYDLDGDGDLDLLFASTFDRKIVMYKQTAPLVFESERSFTVGGEPIAVLCADFDNDGDPDIASLNEYTNAISLYRNDGIMQFTGMAANLYVGYPASFLVADFNNDGFVDLVANNSDNYFSYFKNTGNFAFTRSTTNLTGDHILGQAAADFDNDGDIDLAFTAFPLNTLVIAANSNGSAHAGEPGNLIPKQYVLHQNYPNPFNPKTTIHYELPHASYVTVTLHNMLGQKVTTLINEIQGPGYRSVDWDATNQASGVYFVRFTAKVEGKAEYSMVNKVVLIK